MYSTRLELRLIYCDQIVEFVLKVLSQNPIGLGHWRERTSIAEEMFHSARINLCSILQRHTGSETFLRSHVELISI